MNTNHKVTFFLHTPSGDTPIEVFNNVTSNNFGELVKTGSAISWPSQGEFLFFGRVEETVNVHDTNLLAVQILGLSLVTADPAFRILPTLHATVEGIPPATPALLEGVEVEFAAAGHTLCVAVTNADGVATCHLLGVVLGPATYTARFAGDDRFFPSEDTAPFVP